MFKIDLILKEWSAIFSFFELKKYCIIFRKGGIHEKEFLEIESYFGIFKTHEHESIETLKPSCKSFLNNSTVGKSISEHIKIISEDQKSELLIIEKKLIEKEKNLIAKKNVIEKNEFEVCELHLHSLKSGYMKFLSNFIKLQNQFSQLLDGQNAKFLCLSNRKFS